MPLPSRGRLQLVLETEGLQLSWLFRDIVLHLNA